MPWLPNGDYYIFDEDSIRAKAPPISGVYGLYNFKHQVFIGETADIRDALLQHATNPAFGVGKCRPTGFTFEACPASARAERAQQLIDEYRPVLQARGVFGLGRLWVARKNRPATAFQSYSAVTPVEAKPDNEEPSKAADETNKTPVKPFYFSRRQILSLALAFIVTGVVIAALGIFTGIKIEQRRSIKDEKSVSPITVVHPLMDFETPEPAQIEESPSNTAGTTEPPALSDLPAHKSAGTEKAAPHPAAEAKALVPLQSGGGPSERSVGSLKQEQVAGIIRPDQKNLVWSVQVRSSAEKNQAAQWVDGLNGKGYPAFWVEAEVKGKTWYRVRVGHLKDRHEAETLRQTLEVKEGFRDAFLTQNAPPGTFLTNKTQ